MNDCQEGAYNKNQNCHHGLACRTRNSIAGTLFFQQYNPKDPADQNPNPAPVFDRIVAQNELVCASQQYNITEKATNSNSFFELFDIPFTENHFWYRYVGTIKVGVNLKEAEFATKDKVITVSLTQPYIISNTPDLNKSGTLEEGINPLNPIHAKDVDAFQRQCVEQSQTDIIDGGIMDEAKQMPKRTFETCSMQHLEMLTLSNSSGGSKNEEG